MIKEIIVIYVLLGGGVLLLRSLGLRGWPLLPLGFLSGISLFTALLYLQMLTIHTQPKIPLALTIILPLSLWLWRWRKGIDISLPVLPSIISLILVALVVAIFSKANLVRFHSDSLNFLLVAAGFYLGDNSLISSFNIENRLSTVSAIHSLGHFASNFYLLSLTPLVSLSILGTLAWILKEGLRKTISNTNLIIFTIAGILLLVTSHNYLFHSFYINGHLLTAAFTLLLVGCGWLLTRGDRDVPAAVLLALMIVGILGMVFTRVEGFIFAAIALLPTLVYSKVTQAQKKLLIIALSAAIMLQQLTKIVLIQDIGDKIDKILFGFLVLGAITLLIIPLLKWKALFRRPIILLWLTEAGLWVALLLMTLLKPDIFTKSLNAVWVNTVVHLSPWGYYLVMLGAVVAIVLVFYRFQYQIFLRLPVTTFLPLAFVIAYLKNGPYRVGNADSLNRMLIQVVPIAVLYIIVAIACGQNRFNKHKRRPG